MIRDKIIMLPGCPNSEIVLKDQKSFKPQAPSLTTGPGYSRMNLERNNYAIKKTNQKNK